MSTLSQPRTPLTATPTGVKVGSVISATVTNVTDTEAKTGAPQLAIRVSNDLPLPNGSVAHTFYLPMNVDKREGAEKSAIEITYEKLEHYGAFTRSELVGKEVQLQLKAGRDEYGPRWELLGAGIPQSEAAAAVADEYEAQRAAARAAAAK